MSDSTLLVEAKGIGMGVDGTVHNRFDGETRLGSVCDQHLNAAAFEGLGVCIGDAVVGDEGMDQF